MKIILNAFLKFFIILLISFSIFFFAFILFNYMPFLKISGDKTVFKDIINAIVTPSFYHALFNSLIMSIFIYGIFILNYEKQSMFFSFLMPVIFTTLLVFSVYYFFKPVQKNLNYYDIEDARLFFSEKSFFFYDEKIPEEFSKNIFENTVLKKTFDNADRKLLEKNYYLDYKKDIYKLKDEIFLPETDRILTVLYKIGFFEEIKLYFDKVEKKSVTNAIIIKGGKIDFYKILYVDFIEDRVFISSSAETGKNVRYEFYKNDLAQYLNINSIVNTMFFSNVTAISYKFLDYKNIFKKTLLWFAISFLFLAFSIIIFIGKYPLISMIFKFIFLILFYAYFTYLFDVFGKSTDKLLSADLAMMKDWIFISAIFVLGLILLLLRLLFFKKNSWHN
jgi:hypothetical protein